MTRRLATIILAVVASIGLATSAGATGQTMQDRVDAAIEANPGGVQTGWNEVSWNDGDVVLTLEPDVDATPLAAVGSCADGKYCVFSRANLAGSKLTFTSCTSQSVSALGAPVRSVANARSSGSVTAKNGATTVLTVAAGSFTNTTATITTVSC